MTTLVTILVMLVGMAGALAVGFFLGVLAHSQNTGRTLTRERSLGLERLRDAIQDQLGTHSDPFRARKPTLH